MKMISKVMVPIVVALMIVGCGVEKSGDIFDFELTKEDMQKIAAINKNQRYENW